MTRFAALILARIESLWVLGERIRRLLCSNRFMASSGIKPTVSPAKNSLVYFISIVYIDHPVWRGHSEEAKRGSPCEHRITRNEGAMVPFLLPCATTGWSSIAAWCGSGATPRGQQGAPACTLPRVRDGLRVRCRSTLCPCGRSSLGRPAPRSFLRNALPDLATIVPVTAYYRINYVRDTVGIQ